jgi:cytochrome P450
MLVLACDDETGEMMSERQVRDELMTMLLAGHETSGIALTWAWYLLSQHPEVERRLHTELDTVLGERTPSYDDLAQLRYTRMVIEETLRLYPPAWGIARQCIAPDEIRGYEIPNGAQLMVSQYVTHRHPDFWERPEAFEPERFRPECAAERPKFAYYPFGGGPRLCIGNQFALMEMQVILATLAQRYQLSLVPGHPIEVHPLITLGPRLLPVVPKNSNIGQEPGP